MKYQSIFVKDFYRVTKRITVRWIDEDKMYTRSRFHHDQETERGKESVTVEITINTEKLARSLGLDAARNKSGKAILAGGLIKAKVISRHDIEKQEKSYPLPSGMVEVNE